MMKTVSLTALLIVGLLASPVFAQDDVRVLQFARFESGADYKAYSDWIADIENIRFSIIASGKRWTPDVEAWVKNYIQEPANVESNDDVYLITYAEGGLDKKTAQVMLDTLVRAYSERLRRRARREEEEHRNELDLEFGIMNRELRAAGLGEDDESLSAELRDINDQLLKAKLQAAQAEARARALMEHERKRFIGTPGANSASKVEDLRRDLAMRKLEKAKLRLAGVERLQEKDFVTEEDVSAAEIAYSEAELEFAELREAAARAGFRSKDPDLRPLLIEAEAERASALALDAVLREHEMRLREMLEKQSLFKERKRALDERKRALDSERRKLENVQMIQARGLRAVGTMQGGPTMIYPES